MSKNNMVIKIILTIFFIIFVLFIITLGPKQKSHPQKKYDETNIAVDLADAYKMLIELDANMTNANGPKKDWRFGDPVMDEDFSRYFKPYLKVREICGHNKDTCFASSYTKLGGPERRESNYYILLENGSSLGIWLASHIKRYSFWNGTSSTSGASSGEPLTPFMGHIYVDLNGPKPPNIVGKDLFKFTWFDNHLGLQPYCTYDSQGKRVEAKYIKDKCNEEDGACCGAVLLAGMNEPNKPSESKQVVVLKEAYKMLKDFEKRAVAANGPIGDWNQPRNAEFYSKYISPYLYIQKNCGNGPGCFAPVHHYRSSGNHDYEFNEDSKFSKALLQNGMSFAYRIERGSYGRRDASGRVVRLENHIIGVIYIDINGSKPPNVLSEDLFSFDVFTNDLGIQPTGKYEVDGTARTLKEISEYCKTGSGHECSAMLLGENP